MLIFTQAFRIQTRAGATLRLNGLFISTLLYCGLLANHTYSQTGAQSKQPNYQTQTQQTENDQAIWTKVFKSKNELFKLKLKPLKPIQLRKLQTWVLEVESTKTGMAIERGRVTMDGGMPSHGHGLPSKPSIRATNKNGTYIIEGLKFSMGGEWLLSFNVSSTDFDRAELVFDLPH